MSKRLVSDLDSYDDVSPAATEDQKTVAGLTRDETALPKSPPPSGKIFDENELAPEWQSEAPVLCVAGRAPLDEAVANMLAQLLGKHGLRARLTRYETVSRTSIRSFDFRDTAMVCISYIDIRGNPAHLHYLLRRLRERLPHAQFLVGFWPLQDPILKDLHLRQTFGADFYVSTLNEAVAACLAAAHKSAARQMDGTTSPPAEASD
jgi:hypothetical protein